ncbi:MAG TPA: hypothetical protein DCQ92_03415 [Verrucomicrobia subdivision 3 bacterium]|nr:hypothetical protein [Limisphaerales bacterium]
MKTMNTKPTLKLALCALALSGLVLTAQAQTPLYQWNFNGSGTGTGVPNVTSGGGSLTASGTGSFTGAGASGQPGDFAYSSTSASGYANAGITTAGDTLTGLSGLNQFTITFWLNPFITYSNQPAVSGTTVSRFLQIGPVSGYDEASINTQGGANNANAGISIALNNISLQVGVGQAPAFIANNAFASYGANQWVMVALEYDGTAISANSSSSLATAIGNGAGDAAVFISTPGNLGGPIMLGMTNTAGAVVSPGLTASELLLLANRNNPNRGWDGEIDNVGIYNGLLTTSQLNALTTAVPEPATVTMLGLGSLVGVIALRRRRS